jgi:hypothetical protein
MSNKPNITIRYIDGCDQDPPDMGHLVVEVNGVLSDSILTDFDTGNDARIHMGLRRIVERVYAMGREAGIIESKKRITDLLDWAKGSSE